MVGVRLAFLSPYKIDIWKLLVSQLVFGEEKSRKANKFLMLTEKRGRVWKNRRTYQMKTSEAFGKPTFFSVKKNNSEIRTSYEGGIKDDSKKVSFVFISKILFGDQAELKTNLCSGKKKNAEMRTSFSCS